MERLIFWPFDMADRIRHWWFRWCWPYCLPPKERLENPNGSSFPIRLKCTKCGKIFEA